MSMDDDRARADDPWDDRITPARTDSTPPSALSAENQTLWNAFRDGVATCPEDGGTLALSVAPAERGQRGHAYRLSCIKCGWCTPLFS